MLNFSQFASIYNTIENSSTQHDGQTVGYKPGKHRNKKSSNPRYPCNSLFFGSRSRTCWSCAESDNINYEIVDGTPSRAAFPSTQPRSATQKKKRLKVEQKVRQVERTQEMLQLSSPSWKSGQSRKPF